MQDPGGLELVTETTRFDENGNPEEVVDPKGQTTTNTYDELNRLKTTSFAFDPEDADAPVALHQPASSTPTTRTTTCVRSTSPWPAARSPDHADDDPDLRLPRPPRHRDDAPPRRGGDQTVAYTYFRNGLRKTVTDPADLVTAYTYDGKNRLETATTASGTPEAATTIYGYFPDDLLETVAYPNGVSATHTYDKADRLLSVTNALGRDVVSSYEYSGWVAAESRLLRHATATASSRSRRTAASRETTRYTYDDLNRLKTVTYPADSVYPQGREVSYSYDAVGNRIGETEQEPGGGAVLADRQGVFDNVNRLETLTDLSKPEGDPERETLFTWDKNGNQLTKTVGTARPPSPRPTATTCGTSWSRPSSSPRPRPRTSRSWAASSTTSTVAASSRSAK